MSSELVNWPEKVAANLKVIEEASEPENLISGKPSMMIHPHPPAKLPEAIEEGKVHRLCPETKLECAFFL